MTVASGPADEEILTLAVKDPRHFRLIIERYEAAFLRKAKSILGEREEVADVVAETFTKIYFNAARFHPVEGASFRSWAYRILVNTALTYYQKLKKRRGDLPLTEVELGTMVDHRGGAAFEQAEWRDYVASYLHRLPAATSRILRLFFLEDRPQEEIAALEGVSVAAVKTRLHRAKKEFKKFASLIKI